MTLDATRILIVGAGAVGTVYGRHLQLGGADLSYLVRPHHGDRVSTGLTVYHLNKSGRKRTPERFVPDDVFTTVDDVAAAGRFDQIWLCVSATALRKDDLLPALTTAITRSGGSPTWVLPTPGLEDRALLAEHVPSDAIVQGVIAMVSYNAPLEGSREKVPEPGVAYFFPPGGKQSFSGASRRARAVVAALVAGKCAAAVVDDAGKSSSMASAVMMPYLVALEAADWSFKSLKSQPDLLSLASQGAEQATAVVAAHQNPKGKSSLTDGLMGKVAQPWLLKLVMTVGARLAPFDLEAYFAHHFTKVGDQTLYMMDRYIALGEEHARPVGALRQLLDRVDPE